MRKTAGRVSLVCPGPLTQPGASVSRTLPVDMDAYVGERVNWEVCERG